MQTLVRYYEETQPEREVAFHGLEHIEKREARYRTLLTLVLALNLALICGIITVVRLLMNN